MIDANEFITAYLEKEWLNQSEKQFQEWLVREAKSRDWELIYHTWNSKNSAKGFPDLVMLKGNRQIYAELKSHKNRKGLSDDQKIWINHLRAITCQCGCGNKSNEVYVWYPKHKDQILEVLNG